MDGERATAMRLEEAERYMASLSMIDEMLAAAAVEGVEEGEELHRGETKWEESMEALDDVRNAGDDVWTMLPLGMESRPGIRDLLMEVAPPDEPPSLLPPTSSHRCFDEMRAADGTHPSTSRTSNPIVLPPPSAPLTAVSYSGATSDASLSRAAESIIEGFQVRRSSAFSDGGGVFPSGVGGERTEKGTTAGLGVFCERALKAGEIVLEERALLRVSRQAVEPAVWEAVTRSVTAIAKHSRLAPMDLLQAVAFNDAEPSIQDRVLQLVRAASIMGVVRDVSFSFVEAFGRRVT